MAVVVTPEDIRRYIRDRVDVNYLYDNEVQFSDDRINNAMELVVSDIDITAPVTNYGTLSRLPPQTKSLVVIGTLKHLFFGEAGLAARNQFSYSDGGLTIPLEERFQYWITLAQQYEQSFMSMLKQWKIAANMDGALNGNRSWGEVRSDFAKFPKW